MQHTIDNGGASAMRENGNRCMDFDNDNSNGCDGGNHDFLHRQIRGEKRSATANNDDDGEVVETSSFTASLAIRRAVL